jgi:dihydrofolate synthase/folylpolyglutamate synthase
VTYLDALRYLYSLADFERSGRFADRQDVEPVRALLGELGDPHLGRVTVHIAGSKGKGSVAAMVASMLKSAGLKTGLFTSPHLNRFPERIQVDGEAVSNDEFAVGLDEVAAAVERVKERMPDRQVLTFDALTALGFVLFRQREVEAQVIEVGLGGTLDSTNVFGPGEKQVTVITNIGLEHREILGDTVPEIAAQKAGIIVAGCPTVMAPQRESAAEVIREVATERGSTLIEVAGVCNLRRDSMGTEFQNFRLRTPRAGYNIKLPLLGKHQLDNAAAAVLTVEALSDAGIPIGEEAIRTGLEAVKWPARIEAIKRRPLVIVDAAHTADSARRLRDTLDEYFHVKGATLVIGVMGDKDLEGLAMAVEPVAHRVIATAADHPRALEAVKVARIFQEMGIETLTQPKLGDAIDVAMSLAGSSGAVVILGSVALAGEARAYVLGLERDPPVNEGPILTFR